MKTIRILLLLLVATTGGLRSVRAQLLRNAYFNVDWQYNVPLGRSYADGATGWGMSFEGGYYPIPELSVGGFLSYHTNFRSMERATLRLAPGRALTTAQEQALYQLPFGAAMRWTFRRDCVLEPYFGAKLGACFARLSSSGSLYRVRTDAWGFYLQPELGVSIFPEPLRRFGLHLALYYGYATDSARLLVYSMERISQFGVRAGISF